MGGENIAEFLESSYFDQVILDFRPLSKRPQYFTNEQVAMQAGRLPVSAVIGEWGVIT